MQDIKHFIGGEFMIGGAEVFESHNPAMPDQVLGRVHLGDEQMVAAAVEAAVGGYERWRTDTGSNRASALHLWAEKIQGRSSELAEAIANEVGKPILEARGEVGRCVAILRYYAGEAVRPIGDVIPGLSAGSLQYSLKAPLGVVGLITPWNFPLAIPLWKAAPALAMGNVVVLKPSEHSGWCGQLLAETAHAAGLGDIFQVVQGAAAAGKALVEHTQVAAISFTGSDKTGHRIAKACADHNKKFQTEMGGKNVAIVLHDADLVQAANLVAGGAMRFAGQKCTATSRVVVESAIAGRFKDELKKACDALKVGSPTEASTAIGPVITKESQGKLLHAIQHGDRIYTGAIPDYGYFVPPVVIGGLDEMHELSQQEMFGPVLSFFEAGSFDQALEIANHTRFGLSASLCTRDLGNALKYIDRIQVGMVRVNADTTGVDPHAPFGGFKGSSSGTREQGVAAKEFYTQIKTVQINP